MKEILKLFSDNSEKLEELSKLILHLQSKYELVHRDVYLSNKSFKETQKEFALYCTKKVNSLGFIGEVTLDEGFSLLHLSGYIILEGVKIKFSAITGYEVKYDYLSEARGEISVCQRVWSS